MLVMDPHFLLLYIGHASIFASNPLLLQNILLVPAIKKNLISISQFTLHNNVIVEFDFSYCYVKDKVIKAITVPQSNSLTAIYFHLTHCNPTQSVIRSSCNKNTQLLSL